MISLSSYIHACICIYKVLWVVVLQLDFCQLCDKNTLLSWIYICNTTASNNHGIVAFFDWSLCTKRKVFEHSDVLFAIFVCWLNMFCCQAFAQAAARIHTSKFVLYISFLHRCRVFSLWCKYRENLLQNMLNKYSHRFICMLSGLYAIKCQKGGRCCCKYRYVCGFICVSMCQSIQIKPTNMYIASARTQFKINTRVLKLTPVHSRRVVSCPL